MRRFMFTEDQRRIIESERYCHPNPRVQRRMEMLWLKCNGETHERIAELAGVDRRTVQRLLDIFEVGGLESVRNFGEKGRVNGLAPYREPVEAAFRERPPRTVAEACDRIEQLTGAVPRTSGSCVPRTAAAYGRRGVRPHRTIDGGSSGPYAGTAVLAGRFGPALEEGRRFAGSTQAVGGRTRPNAGGFFKRRSLSRDWLKPARENARCFS